MNTNDPKAFLNKDLELMSLEDEKQSIWRSIEEIKQEETQHGKNCPKCKERRQCDKLDQITTALLAGFNAYNLTVQKIKDLRAQPV